MSVTTLKLFFAGDPISGSFTRIKEYFTSSASKSDPSWNLTPFLSLKVHSVASAFADQSVANSADVIPLRSFLTNRFCVIMTTWNNLPLVIASKLVSFPKPRSCESLNVPLDALANENDNINDTKQIDIVLKMFFIINFLSLFLLKLTPYVI